MAQGRISPLAFASSDHPGRKPAVALHQPCGGGRICCAPPNVFTPKEAFQNCPQCCIEECQKFGLCNNCAALLPPPPTPPPVPRSNPGAWTDDNYRKKAGIGDWGGKCTCPSGKTYDVGDNDNECASLACEGGTAGQCSEKGIPPSRYGWAVTCGTGPGSIGFTKEAGAGCGTKNDISCGEYSSRADLEAACVADDRCVAYSTWDIQPGEGGSWCMKSKYTPGDGADGHDCYVITRGKGKGAPPTKSPAAAPVGPPTPRPTKEPTRSPTAKITTTTWAGLDHVTRTTTAALPATCTGCKQGFGPERKFGQCRTEIIAGFALCQKYTPGTTQCPDGFAECEGEPTDATDVSPTTAAQDDATTIAQAFSANTIATTAGAPADTGRNATSAPNSSTNVTAAAIATTAGAPADAARNATSASNSSRNSTAAATVSSRPSTVSTEGSSETTTPSEVALCRLPLCGCPDDDGRPSPGPPECRVSGGAVMGGRAPWCEDSPSACRDCSGVWCGPVLGPGPVGTTAAAPSTHGPPIEQSEHPSTAATESTFTTEDLEHSCPRSATATYNATLGAVLCRCAQPDASTPEPAEPARTDCIGLGTSCIGSATAGWYWFDGECEFCFCAAPYFFTQSNGASTPRIGSSPAPSQTTPVAPPNGDSKPSAEVATTTLGDSGTEPKQSESETTSSGARTVVVLVAVILVLLVLGVATLAVVRKMTAAPAAAAATNEPDQVREAAASGMTNNPAYLAGSGMAQLDNAASRDSAAAPYEQVAPSWMRTAVGARGAPVYGQSHPPLDQEGYVAELSPGPSRLLDSQGYVLDRDAMPAGQTGQPTANKEAWRAESMPSPSTSMMLDNQGYVLDRDTVAPAHAAVYSVPMEVEQSAIAGPGKDGATDSSVLYCMPLSGSRVAYQASGDVKRVGPGEAAAGEPLSDYIEVKGDADNGQGAERSSSA